MLLHGREWLSSLRPALVLEICLIAHVRGNNIKFATLRSVHSRRNRCSWRHFSCRIANGAPCINPFRTGYPSYSSSARTRARRGREHSWLAHIWVLHCPSSQLRSQLQRFRREWTDRSVANLMLLPRTCAIRQISSTSAGRRLLSHSRPCSSIEPYVYLVLRRPPTWRRRRR
eukprot:COSAG02_NODE_29120_length_575_cov_5.842437_1_plen_171_part_01